MTSVKINLPNEAYQQAIQFQQQQSSSKQSNIVYFNTLAVYAVFLYFQSWKIETDLPTSDAWDCVMQTLLDVADLNLKNWGKIECRPIFPQHNFVYIPPEVWEERIAYIIVEINEFLRQATLRGFLKRVDSKKIPLEQLHPMKEFMSYLDKGKH